VKLISDTLRYSFIIQTLASPPRWRRHGANIAIGQGCLLLCMSLFVADIVAKVPKGAAANFPPKNETSDNRRSVGLQTRYQNRL